MTAFYTFRKNVRLKAGQIVKFLKGHGYYAAAPNALVPKPPPSTPTARERYVSALRWMVTHNSLFVYSETRPIPVSLRPFQTEQRIITDCSGSVTLAAKWAGCPDPNGRGFDGQGYTGTILDHCEHISRGAVKPGDLIVYGSGTGHHVVAVLSLQASGDFEVFSHGAPGDPHIVSHSVEAANQARYGATAITYCRFIP